MTNMKKGLTEAKKKKYDKEIQKGLDKADKSDRKEFIEMKSYAVLKRLKHNHRYVRN